MSSFAILLDFNGLLNDFRDVETILSGHGFTRQGTLFLGNANVNAIDTILAVQDVKRKLPYFENYVTECRLLRIEENCELMRALK